MKCGIATVDLERASKIIQEEIEKTKHEMSVANFAGCSLAALLHPTVDTLGSLEDRIVNRLRHEA